ncbi:MAG: TetR/AcrR family transcriptional regulator [Actinomycetota bacterium]|nr:TetR/AcrR family transcriptional regulator [Actinomycetota bacterium]
MAEVADRPYHHGKLRETLIAAAVAEVETVGAAGVSLREIARRAGVSHAAPAHHFGDKAGVFTAIATDGFRLAADVIGPAASGPFGFLHGGVAYIEFAISHPGHFEVMFRPDLYRGEDPELIEARDAAFRILYGSAQTLLGTDSPDEITGVVIAGWSLSHGFATLWLNANLEDRLGPDPASIAEQLNDGLIALGRAAQRQREHT